MAINPDNITTIRVDQLPEDVISLVNEFAHTNGTELKKATIQSLVDLVAAAVGAGSGVGFLPISVTDGQQLPDVPAEPSFFLAGIGTFLNINGYPDLICTEELNAIMSLTDHWEIAVEIPIALLSGAVQSVTGSAVDNTDPLNPIINSTGGGGSQSLDEVLAVGSVASIVTSNTDTYSVSIPFDDGIDIYAEDRITDASGDNITNRLMLAGRIDNSVYQKIGLETTLHENWLQNLDFIEGEKNRVHYLTRIGVSGSGQIGINIPTPNQSASVEINFPYREVTGDYTLATIDELPTNTSDLINDGEDGVHPYITLLDLPSNLILYPTTVASDVVGYVKLVTDIHDPEYNVTAVDVSTGVITTTNQLISSLITVPDLINGNPGVFNTTTIGNIRRSAGSGTAEFYFNIYKRDSLGTETLIGVSNPTLPVNNGVYAEFSATAIWDDGVFTATDRIVLKFYGSRIAGGSNPTYEFQFGGTTPVRTLVPIPLSVVPSIPNATETVAGIAEIATTAEVSTGTDDERIVTPLKLKQSLSEVTINSLSNGLAYFLPTVGSSTFNSLLRSNAPTLSGNTGVFEAVTNILFSTTATAGTLAAQRGSPIYYSLSLISFLNYTRKFKINSNVTDTRFFCGISNMYGAAAPTNVAPDTQINTIGVCKMASSQNLQVLYNDATGLATLIDLGVNFPANNVVDYWYHLNIKKENNSTNIVVTVTRTDVTGASIVAVNTITTNYNNSIIHFPTMWICNNATATIASYKDFGCISEFNQLF